MASEEIGSAILHKEGVVDEVSGLKKTIQILHKV